MHVIAIAGTSGTFRIARPDGQRRGATEGPNAVILERGNGGMSGTGSAPAASARRARERRINSGRVRAS
jgi:hypothetical protein